MGSADDDAPVPMEETKLQGDVNSSGKRSLDMGDNNDLTVEQQQQAQNIRAPKAKAQPKEQISAGDMAIEIAKIREEEAKLPETTVRPADDNTPPTTPSSSSSSSSSSPNAPMPAANSSNAGSSSAEAGQAGSSQKCG